MLCKNDTGKNHTLVLKFSPNLQTMQIFHPNIENVPFLANFLFVPFFTCVIFTGHHLFQIIFQKTSGHLFELLMKF